MGEGEYVQHTRCTYMKTFESWAVRMCAVKYPTKEDVLLDASSRTRDKSWPHCQGPHRLSQSHNCPPHSEDLVWSYTGSQLSVWNQWAPIRSGQQFLWVSPSCSWPLCSYYGSSLSWTTQSKHRGKGLGLASKWSVRLVDSAWEAYLF